MKSLLSSVEKVSSRCEEVNSQGVVTIPVKGDDLTIVDMIPGYTHSITNTGKVDLVFFIWAGSEVFDPSRPDTTFNVE